MMLALVLVLVSVDREGLPQSPDPNTEQHYSDQSLAPGGKKVNWQMRTQPKREQSYHGHPCGMSQPPAGARYPGATWFAHRQRSDRSQMVRSRPDMDCSRKESGNSCNHSFRTRV